MKIRAYGLSRRRKPSDLTAARFLPLAPYLFFIATESKAVDGRLAGTSIVSRIALIRVNNCYNSRPRPASHTQYSQPGIDNRLDKAVFPMKTSIPARTGALPLRLKLLSVLICNVFALPLAGAAEITLGEVEVQSEAQGSFTSTSVQVGTFRDQSPVDVPLTTNVVTRETLDAQGQRTLFGALRNTAGVTRSQLSGSTYDNIAIRGILVENVLLSEISQGR